MPSHQLEKKCFLSNSSVQVRSKLTCLPFLLAIWLAQGKLKKEVVSLDVNHTLDLFIKPKGRQEI